MTMCPRYCRRRRPGTELKEVEYCQVIGQITFSCANKNGLYQFNIQVGRNAGIHGSQVEELTTSFDGRETTPTPTNRPALPEATPAPERMLLGGREPCSQQQQPLRPLASIDSTFTQTIKLKLPPSPNPGVGPTHSNRMQLPHCTLPRSRAHKEVTFNPQATFQVNTLWIN